MSNSRFTEAMKARLVEKCQDQRLLKTGDPTLTIECTFQDLVGQRAKQSVGLGRRLFFDGFGFLKIDIVSDNRRRACHALHLTKIAGALMGLFFLPRSRRTSVGTKAADCWKTFTGLPSWKQETLVRLDRACPRQELTPRLIVKAPPKRECLEGLKEGCMCLSLDGSWAANLAACFLS